MCRRKEPRHKGSHKSLIGSDRSWAYVSLKARNCAGFSCVAKGSEKGSHTPFGTGMVCEIGSNSFDESLCGGPT